MGKRHPPRGAHRAARTPGWLPGAVVLALGLASQPAYAYPWMIKHGYTNCSQCHVDPSGAGTLTEYGRAQGEILVRTHYKKMTEDPGKQADFAFGVVKLPEPLSLQFDLRDLVIPEPGNIRVILMQADLRAAIQAGAFTAGAAIGPVSEGANAARLTSNTTDPQWNLTSREYWAGVTPTKGLMIRAGRMNLPFGIRTEDHELYVRSATRTSGNADQQTGLSIVYGSKKLRFEVMGIAGNFQVRPDVFRERGYSLYGSYAVTKKFELGVSSLLTIAGADIETLAPRTRQAHGVYTRASPIDSLAIMAEADLLVDDNSGVGSMGVASTGILDWEPTQGLHIMGVGQFCDPDFADPASPAWTGGGAVQWFFMPRVDIRVDVLDGVLSCTAGATPSAMGLVQGHFYL